MTDETATLSIEHDGIKANWATELDRKKAVALKRVIEIGVMEGEWSDETISYARMLAAEFDQVGDLTDE